MARRAPSDSYRCDCRFQQLPYIQVHACNIKARIPAFMAGMCIMFAGRGAAQGASQSFSMTLPKEYKVLQNVWFYLGMVLLIFVAAYILFEYTKIGKYNKLIGSNPRCASLSGIDVGKYKTIAFVISGFAVGMAAFMTVIRGGGVGNLESDESGMAYAQKVPGS